MNCFGNRRHVIGWYLHNPEFWNDGDQLVGDWIAIRSQEDMRRPVTATFSFQIALSGPRVFGEIVNLPQMFFLEKTQRTHKSMFCC